MKTIYVALTATTIGMMRCRPSLKASYDPSLVSALRCVSKLVENLPVPVKYSTGLLNASATRGRSYGAGRLFVAKIRRYTRGLSRAWSGTQRWKMVLKTDPPLGLLPSFFVKILRVCG